MKRIRILVSVIECNEFGEAVDEDGNLIPPDQPSVGKKFGSSFQMSDEYMNPLEIGTCIQEVWKELLLLTIKATPWTTRSRDSGIPIISPKMTLRTFAE